LSRDGFGGEDGNEMNDKEFINLVYSAPKSEMIYKYLLFVREKLNSYNRIAVSVSGGSDSDTIIDIIELVKPLDCGEIKYVFFDTMFEYDATYRHLDALEEKYGITIERRKSEKSIPTVCGEHGVPFISKHASECIELLQKNKFNWAELFDDAETENQCSKGLKWFYDLNAKPKRGKKDQFNISRFRLLRDFMVLNPPDFNISDKCCDYAKKLPAKAFDDDFRPDLKITGMRQSEGGRRIASRSSCFKPKSDKNRCDEFCPLWFWSDKDKAIYKEWRGMKYSDCYEVWGMKRTGCIGCPCNSKAEQELKIVDKYEPNKVKAAYVVFGQSYKYRRKYNQFKRHGGLNQIALEGFEC
jgi:3'-phosphoadenosine 5'-phosphosulfate sulfotransferase (PAPS reductase)/FAD synthetase